MKTISITTISLLLFYIFTVSHALYVFTDLTHLSNVDIDADDDYRGPPKILLPSGGEGPMKERHRVPAKLRLFPHQCHQNGKAHSDMVEASFDVAKSVFGENGGGASSDDGTHEGHMAQVKENVMMLMLKRPYSMIPYQRVHHKQQQQENQNGNDGVSKDKEENRNEEVKEADSYVLKRIRKIMSNI